jgi:flagellar motor component MotA
MELLSIPAVIALVEALKRTGMPSKYAPLVAIAIGGLFGLAMGNWVAGLVIGLASSGAYSGAKKMLEG